MKRTLATILITAATMSVAGVSIAATAEAKTSYKAAKESAAAEYKVANEKCQSLTGNPKTVCVAEAKAARTRTQAEAEAQYKNTLAARTNARTAIANAEYDVAKAKCGSQTGNDKDVCIEQAKAAKVAAKADAAADKKVVTARTEAKHDKLDANYKVAIEKCEAIAGASKDSCVTSAKARYGK